MRHVAMLAQQYQNTIAEHQEMKNVQSSTWNLACVVRLQKVCQTSGLIILHNYHINVR